MQGLGAAGCHLEGNVERGAKEGESPILKGCLEEGLGDFCAGELLWFLFYSL